MSTVTIKPEVQIVLMDATINFYKQQAMLYMQRCLELENELKNLRDDDTIPVITTDESATNAD